jgi:uncharacterized damage-inducible protein DinB
MENAVAARFDSQWRFARGLTRDLLLSLEISDLSFSPGASVGSLWKHFRHVGRVQENYVRAMETGKVVFGFDGTSYAGGASKQGLIEYLDRLDLELRERLMTRGNADQLIEWPGERIDSKEHLARLADHEILHHGMFIVCLQLLGRRFPKSWEAGACNLNPAKELHPV